MIQMKIDKRGLVQLMSEPQNTSENQLQNLNDIFDIDGQTNGAQDQDSSIRSQSLRQDKLLVESRKAKQKEKAKKSESRQERLVSQRETQKPKGSSKKDQFLSSKEKSSPKIHHLQNNLRALNKSENSNRLFIKKKDARSRTISVSNQNFRMRRSSLINNDMNSPSISLTKDIRFCKALPVSNFNVKPIGGKNSKKNSYGSYAEKLNSSPSKNKNSSVCRFKRSSSSPSPVVVNSNCEQNVVSTIKIQNIRDDESAKETSDQNILNKSNEGKLLSNSSNSFELLNNEIQNTIKEGKDISPIQVQEASQVLPQDSASQVANNDIVDSSQNESFPQYQLSLPQSNKLVQQPYQIQDANIDNSFCGQSIVSQTSLSQKFFKGINDRDNLGASQQDHQISKKKQEKEEAKCIFSNPLIDTDEIDAQTQETQEKEESKQDYNNSAPAQSVTNQIQDVEANSSLSNPQQPHTEQQPIIMNLGNLSQQQFRHMDQEHQRMQLQMMMYQAQAQSFAQAQAQLRSQQQSQQAQVNQSNQPRPQNMPQSQVNMQNPIFPQTQPAQLDQAQQPNPFVPPEQYQQFLQFQQFQQFQYYQKMQQQLMNQGVQNTQQFTEAATFGMQNDTSQGNFMNQTQYQWQLRQQHEAMMANPYGMNMQPNQGYANSINSSSRQSQVSQSDTQSRISHQTNQTIKSTQSNRTNTTNKTNKTNLTNATNQTNNKINNQNQHPQQPNQNMGQIPQQFPANMNQIGQPQPCYLSNPMPPHPNQSQQYMYAPQYQCYPPQMGFPQGRERSISSSMNHPEGSIISKSQMSHLDSAMSSCSNSSHADGNYSVSSSNISNSRQRQREQAKSITSNQNLQQSQKDLQLNYDDNSQHQYNRKKGMSEFNQVYKQIPTEKERKKFLIQNALALSQDHAGCRRLQKKIDEDYQKNNLQFCEDLLNVLIEYFSLLMIDQFANYLCQKLIKVAKTDQIDRILKVIKKDFVRIAMDQHGTRPLQKLLDNMYPLTIQRSHELSEAIRNNVYELSVNIHGNHVVQTCLDILIKDEHKEPIYQTVIKNSLKIAQDKQGCCVMQTCLKTGSLQQQSQLINEVVKNVKELINDQFANYVVSEVINFNDQAINLEITKIISQNLLTYCTSKYSSSVVEILLNNSNTECQQIIFDVFLDKNVNTPTSTSAQQSSKKKNLFRDIMLNQYGNYTISTIIQKAFEFHNKKYIKFFLKIFRENTENLKRINFGKKFINKIDQIITTQQQFQSQQTQKEKQLHQSQISYKHPEMQMNYHKNQPFPFKAYQSDNMNTLSSGEGGEEASNAKRVQKRQSYFQESVDGNSSFRDSDISSQNAGNPSQMNQQSLQSSHLHQNSQMGAQGYSQQYNFNYQNNFSMQSQPQNQNSFMGQVPQQHYGMPQQFYQPNQFQSQWDKQKHYQNQQQ